MHGVGTKTAITTTDATLPKRDPLTNAWWAYRMRWKRRRMLWRARQSRQQLTSISNKTDSIPTKGCVLFCTMRNESQRLPYFLDYYRALGVVHFIFVDNDSSDGGPDLISTQPDCSLWHSAHSYKASRFGVDWMNHLLARYGHRRWCLTVDIDEIFTYARCDRVELGGLTTWLDRTGVAMFGALMLDMYPQSPVGDVPYQIGTDPLAQLNWFDKGPYRAQRQELLQNLWVQGGARERVFFKDTPRHSPTLNKIPLVKWHRSFAYMNSTHSMLPRGLNAAYIGMDGKQLPSGALLHTKFLNTIVEKSSEEKRRKEHFTNSADFDKYYDALVANPTLWHRESTKYEGPEQLQQLGLIVDGGW